MEIKIQCDCGQRYKLDVEPANGVMPFAVNCPICGVDGTQKGTDIIQSFLSSAAAPAAVSPPSAPAKLRLSHDTPAHAPVSPAETAPPADTPRQFPGRIGSVAATDATVTNTRKPNFGFGLLGGLGGALVGAILYYLIVKTTGIRLSYFAIGVGALAGWMAELCGKGEGSKDLAGITATLTVAFIIAAQYFIVLGIWHEVLGPDFNQPRYDREVKHAQLAMKMVPTGSDAEIRSFLAVDQADADSKPDPASVTDDDIKQFHDVQLPEYRDLAGGKISRDQYNTRKGIDPAKDLKEATDAEGTFKAFFIMRLIRWSNLISLAAAAGIAFRLSANA